MEDQTRGGHPRRNTATVEGGRALLRAPKVNVRRPRHYPATISGTIILDEAGAPEAFRLVLTPTTKRRRHFALLRRAPWRDTATTVSTSRIYEISPYQYRANITMECGPVAGTALLDLWHRPTHDEDPSGAHRITAVTAMPIHPSTGDPRHPVALPHVSLKLVLHPDHAAA